MLQINLYQTMHVMNAFVACEMRENQIRSSPTAIFIGAPTQGPCANFYAFQMCCTGVYFFHPESVAYVLRGLANLCAQHCKKHQTIETSQF